MWYVGVFWVVIVESLAPLVVPVRHLRLDPNNARVGDVSKVAASLRVFGQRKPIVVQVESVGPDGPVGVVLAGNTTLQAAKLLGASEIAAVLVSDDPATATAYALADNRTGEVAVWDLTQLSASLRSLDAAGFEDLDALGWEPAELVPLLGAGGDGAEPESPMVTVRFTTDQWQTVGRAVSAVRAVLADTECTDQRAIELVCAEYLAGC